MCVCGGGMFTLKGWIMAACGGGKLHLLLERLLLHAGSETEGD